MKINIAAMKVLLFFTLLTGVVYPALLVAISKLFFADPARGSLVWSDGKPVASMLLAQKPKSAHYFQPRPSATDYATVPAGASQWGPTHPPLESAIAKRRAFWGKDAPADLLTTSGSGLDPHISPAAAQFQVPLIAKARGWNGTQTAALEQLVERSIEKPTFGFIGQARVNVLMLNRALETLSP